MTQVSHLAKNWRLEDLNGGDLIPNWKAQR